MLVFGKEKSKIDLNSPLQTFIMFNILNTYIFCFYLPIWSFALRNKME